MAKIHKELKKLIDSNKIPPFCLLCGEESYFSEETLEHLKKACETSLNLAFVTYQPKDKQMIEIADELNEISMFSGGKVIVIKNFSAYKKKMQDFEYFIDNPPVQSHLILMEYDKVKYTSGIFKRLNDAGLVFESKRLNQENLIKYITLKFAQLKINIDFKAAIKLADTVGDDLYIINNEIEKLSLWAGSNGTIDEKIIEDVVKNSKERSVYDMANLILDKKFQESCKIALKLLNEGTGFTTILSTITNYFSLILLMSSEKPENINRAELASIFRTHTFYLKNYEQASKIYKIDEISKIFDILLQKELLLKTSSNDEKSLLVSMFSEMELASGKIK